jgi:hypothetical protein
LHSGRLSRWLFSKLKVSKSPGSTSAFGTNLPDALERHPCALAEPDTRRRARFDQLVTKPIKVLWQLLTGWRRLAFPAAVPLKVD